MDMDIVFLVGMAIFWVLNKLGDWFGIGGAIVGGAVTGFLFLGILQILTAKYAPPPPVYTDPTPICQQLGTC